MDVAHPVRSGHRAETAEAVGVGRLSVRGLTKRWGVLTVVDDVELALQPSTLVSLVGANGTGKTTFLRIVAGLIAPDAGTVAVDGLDPVRDRRRYQERIGFLSAAQTGLYARFSVARHLEYWASLAFVERSQRADAVDRMLDGFALRPIAAQRADRLSMGQRQRVRLAMTFLHEPRLVLLDEPRNSLDDEGREALVGVVTAFVERGGSVVWCAPGVEEVDAPVSRSLVLAHGRLVDG
jgi:ABC-type multidrug transport system ATPase subunit